MKNSDWKPRSPKRRRGIGCLGIVLGSVLLFDLLSGCKIMKMRLMPELDRNGKYFYLSRQYPETQFHLWGAALTESDGGPSSFLPSPLALFPGFPLVLVEKFVICPVLDILWLPEDFIRNCYLQSDRALTENGYYIQVMDVWGKPLKGIKVACSAYPSCSRLTPVLKGKRHRDGCIGYTDENGELYVPYDCTTVEGVHVDAYARSAQGEYASTYYEPGYRHPPYVMKPHDYRGAVYKGSVDPDKVFPKREPKRRVRIVLEPELEWPDGRHARWKFIPDGVSELKESEAKALFYGNRPSLDDL